MFQRFIDAANANPAIIGLILCGIMFVAVLILTLDRRELKRKKMLIKNLRDDCVNSDRKLMEANRKIKQLKVDLFMAREDGKIALWKKQAEVDRLTAQVTQLEQDKKQLSKWGSEK